MIVSITTLISLNRCANVSAQYVNMQDEPHSRFARRASLDKTLSFLGLRGVCAGVCIVACAGRLLTLADSTYYSAMIPK